MSFNSPAAAVGCYSTGEEIANSVTHGVAALLSIAGLVVMLSMMPVTAGAPPRSRPPQCSARR